jgi:hypothetical protein
MKLFRPEFTDKTLKWSITNMYLNIFSIAFSARISKNCIHHSQMNIGLLFLDSVICIHYRTI